MRFFISNGANPHLPYDNGVTSLVKSIRCSNYDTMKVLLEYGVDVNFKSNLGNTAIHEILLTDRYCFNHNIFRMGDFYDNHQKLTRGVQLLLEYGADVNVQNVDGVINTPLYFAVSSKTWLCSTGCSNIDLIQLILNANSDVNIQVTKSGCSSSYGGTIVGDTPLHIAVRCEYIELVQLLLLKCHPNLGISNSNNDTVLDIAIKEQKSSTKIMDLIKEETRHQMYTYLLCQWAAPLQIPTIPNRIIGISITSPFILKRKLDQL